MREHFKVTKRFPSEERYGLTDQLRRSSVSIPSNIAEGFHRQGNREKMQFYFIASGSLAELETQLLIAQRVGFLKAENCKELLTEAAIVHKLIYGLIRSIRAKP